jgi:hypothetical protein
MAQLVISNDDLRVRLRLLESVAALRRSFSVPLAAITKVEVLDHPVRTLEAEARLPGGLTRVAVLATPKLRTGDGRAFAAVYRYKRAVAVRLDERTKYRLLVVSCPRPDVVASAISAATGRP